MFGMQIGTLLLVGFMIFQSCGDTLVGVDDPKGELPRDLTINEKLVIEADQSFSYELFRNTVDFDDEENIMISPLSVSMALSMTLNGAEGETFDAMRETLKMSGMNLDEVNDGYRSLIKLLVELDPEVTLKVANSIWHDEGFPVKQEFLERVKDAFGASVEELNFKDPASVDRINDWVNSNTEGLIEKIIDEIPDDMVMYLINVIYFKGNWLYQFDEEDTRVDDFHLESGETKQVDMMVQSDRFATYFSDSVHMIELPYGDSLFSMTVLMPADERKPLNQFISESVTADNLNSWRSNLRTSFQKIPVHLPKFEMEYEIEYNDILKAMGMEIAFDEWNANFKGMADLSPQNLFISEVKHKTFIRVDEKGTEAAAVTSVGIMPTSMPQPMIVNRPFVFIIHERESGTNLFMGKVMNP
jgi:serine protease inhibitor